MTESDEAASRAREATEGGAGGADPPRSPPRLPPEYELVWRGEPVPVRGGWHIQALVRRDPRGRLSTVLLSLRMERDTEGRDVWTQRAALALWAPPAAVSEALATVARDLARAADGSPKQAGP